MAYYRTFLIGNMTSEFGFGFFVDLSFLKKKVTLWFLFLILFSILKNKKNKWRLQTVL